VPDIFDEVADDLRAERTKRFLARWGIVMAAALVLVIAGVAGFEVWRARESRSNAGVADRFIAAMRIADGPVASRAAAIPEFAAIAADGGTGYRTLARLREAALKVDAGDLPGASALWDQVAADGAADRVLRDFADLQWVLRHLDSAEPATLTARIDRLIAPGNAWRAMAQEAQAVLALRQGNKDAARDTLKRLTQDNSAPDGVRGRANGLLARLGG
jgi:hypothetical protein